MFETYLLAISLWTTPVAPLPTAQPVPIDAPVGLDTWQSPDVWSIPVYSAGESDPLQPLLYNEGAWWMVASGRWKRSGNPPEIEAAILQTSAEQFPFPGNVFSSTSAFEWKLPENFNRVINPESGPARFHLRGDMLPAPGPDGHMAVRQPDGTVLETYGTIILSSGQIVALSYGVSRLQSKGDGQQNGQTASMIPSYLGVTDDSEVSGGAIKHPMAITVPPRYLSPQIAYPAYAFDRNAMTEAHPYGGALPMGSHLALSPNIDLARLNLATQEGRIFAQAAKTYGFIIVDRGGEGFTLRIRRNSPEPLPALRVWSRALQSDLNTIFTHLVLVR